MSLMSRNADELIQNNNNSGNHIYVTATSTYKCVQIVVDDPYTVK